MPVAFLEVLLFELTRVTRCFFNQELILSNIRQIGVNKIGPIDSMQGICFWLSIFENLAGFRKSFLENDLNHESLVMMIKTLAISGWQSKNARVPVPDFAVPIPIPLGMLFILEPTRLI